MEFLFALLRLVIIAADNFFAKKNINVIKTLPDALVIRLSEYKPMVYELARGKCRVDLRALYPGKFFK